MSDSVLTIDKVGNKFWKNSKGELHRINGPAAEYKNGNKHWLVNGEWHRLNGPAVEWEDGDTSWYVNDEFLGDNDEGFWALWDMLTPEQKQDPVLLSYLPGNFDV